MRFRALLSTTAVVAVLTGLGVVAPASAAEPLQVSVASGAVLTLPAGDGFNDSIAVSVIGAVDAPIELRAVRAGVDAITLVEGITVSGGAVTVAVPLVAALSAGSWSLEAWTAGADAPLAAGTLLVGSGVASATQFEVSNLTPYPYKDGYRDSVSYAVSATDETGTNLPVSGTATVTYSGAKRAVSAFTGTGAPAKASVSLAGLKPGAYAIRASLRGPGGGTVTTASRPLKLATTFVQTPRVSLSRSSFAPKKDGYRDSVTITVSGRTTSGVAVKATGDVRILKGSKTVKRWTITSTNSKKFTWSGSTIKPGKYTVQYSVRAGDATKASVVKTPLQVSSARLVTGTKKITVSAAESFDGHVSAEGNGTCTTRQGALSCTAKGGDQSGLALIAVSSIGMPKSVVAKREYGEVRVRVSANVESVTGRGMLIVAGASGNSSGNGLQVSRKLTTGWVRADVQQRRQEWAIALGDYASARVKSYTVEFRYKTLKY